MPPEHQKVAADLLLQLDAMRRARQVDQETCQRLASRVAELEDEILRLRALLAGDVVGARTGLRLRPRANDDDRGFTERRDGRLAEGTRDEQPARCDCRCGCTVPVESGRRICARCEAE